MKIQCKFAFLSLLVSMLIFASCASKPSAVEPETPSTDITQTTYDNAQVIEAVTVAEEDDNPFDAEELKQQKEMLEKLLTEARARRQDIITNEFDKLEPENFSIYEEAFNRAADYLDMQDDISPDAAKTASNALKDAETALNGYNEILESVWLSKIDSVRPAAEEARAAALKLKADVAARDDFNAAMENMSKGTANFRNKDFSGAYDNFVQAKTAFDTAAEIAFEKRNLAELALKNAEKKIAESEQIASYAETVIQDRTQQEGEGTL